MNGSFGGHMKFLRPVPGTCAVEGCDAECAYDILLELPDSPVSIKAINVPMCKAHGDEAHPGKAGPSYEDLRLLKELSLVPGHSVAVADPVAVVLHTRTVTRDTARTNMAVARAASLAASGSIFEYWHDAAWAAHEACQEALDVIEKGPTTDE